MLVALYCALFLAGLLVVPKQESTEAIFKGAEREDKEIEVLRSDERRMVILFKALIQMDKMEGLSITPAQAKELLPFVRRNSKKGELSPQDHEKMVDILHARQKRFYDEVQDKIRSYFHGDGINGEDEKLITHEERERFVHEFLTERYNEHQEEKNISSVDPAERMFPPGNGVNVEQQLMNLLETRMLQSP